jgi:hypothetical protein
MPWRMLLWLRSTQTSKHKPRRICERGVPSLSRELTRGAPLTGIPLRTSGLLLLSSSDLRRLPFLELFSGQPATRLRVGAVPLGLGDSCVFLTNRMLLDLLSIVSTGVGQEML